MASRNIPTLSKNSQLLQLFGRLDSGQLRQLRLFLKSPYYNRREDVYALFEYLREDQKRKSPKLGREEVFAAIYPNEAYDDSRLNFVVHLLLNQIKQFLTLQEFEAEEQRQDLYLCRALRKLDAEKPYKKSFDKLKKDLQNHPYRNVGYHYLNYQFYQEEYIHIAS